MIYLTPEKVLFLHAQLVAETGGSHGVRDLNLLLSALGRPQASFDDQDLYPNAAALMDSLIRDHPFVDGNKRTGVAAAALFLRINGYRLTAVSSELEKVTLEVARSEHTLGEIASWLQAHAGAVDQDSRSNQPRKV